MVYVPPFSPPSPLPRSFQNEIILIGKGTPLMLDIFFDQTFFGYCGRRSTLKYQFTKVNRYLFKREFNSLQSGFEKLFVAKRNHLLRVKNFAELKYVRSAILSKTQILKLQKN